MTRLTLPPHLLAAALAVVVLFVVRAMLATTWTWEEKT